MFAGEKTGFDGERTDAVCTDGEASISLQVEVILTLHAFLATRGVLFEAVVASMFSKSNQDGPFHMHLENPRCLSSTKFKMANNIINSNCFVCYKDRTISRLPNRS